MLPVAKELTARLVERLKSNDLAVPPYPAVASRLQGLPRETGLDAVVRTAIAVALGKSAGAAGPLADLRRDEWRRSLLSAVFCKELASRRGVDPDQAFLAGLLHDFGGLVALACLEAEGNLPVLPAVIWRSIVDAVHTELGTIVATRWRLAAPLAAVVAFHHTPANAPPAHRAITQLVQTVDHIISILDRGANTGIAALIEVPGLATNERYSIGGLMPQIAEQMVKFELAAASSQASAVATDDVLEGGWAVDFPCGDKREMGYRACTLSANRIAIHSKTAMSPGWLTELVVCETSPALQLLANVIACTPRGVGDFLVVLQPFGLGGDVKKGWLDLIAKTRAEPPMAAVASR